MDEKGDPMKQLISGRTMVCGLFGFPVEHSFSPAMHNAAFGHLGLDFVYVPFPVPPGELERAVSAIHALNLVGVNVTVPHKEKVSAYLDELTPGAKLTGAVNTIVNQGGRLVGYNTDGAGFIRFLADEARFEPAGKRVLILGAGGAARAVAVHLALAGVSQLVVANRTLQKATVLADLLNDQTPARATAVSWAANAFQPGRSQDEDGPVADSRTASEAELAAWADLIVQTTPLGMHPREDTCPDFPFGCLHSGQVVLDLVYNPPRTLFLERAARAGARVYNGLGMLLYQGALAFELWTGKKAPVEVMRRALPIS